jgi:hypothetical protein
MGVPLHATAPRSACSNFAAGPAWLCTRHACSQITQLQVLRKEVLDWRRGLSLAEGNVDASHCISYFLQSAAPNMDVQQTSLQHK